MTREAFPVPERLPPERAVMTREAFPVPERLPLSERS
jgi:hypothetical protein